MKDHYDFSKGVRGKFYRPLNELKIPVYLDPLITQELNAMMKNDSRDITMLVNDLLRKDIELLRTMHAAQ